MSTRSGPCPTETYLGSKAFPDLSPSNYCWRSLCFLLVIYPTYYLVSNNTRHTCMFIKITCLPPKLGSSWAWLRVPLGHCLFYPRAIILSINTSCMSTCTFSVDLSQRSGIVLVNCQSLVSFGLRIRLNWMSECQHKILR